MFFEKSIFNSLNTGKHQAIKRFSAKPGFPGLGPVSNTGPTSTLGLERTAFIDYLMVRFHGKFSASNPDDLQRLGVLFKILKLDPHYFVEQDVKKWTNFYQYDDGTFIMSSSEVTESNTGASHYLELKGQGCRAFELRGGDWQELLNYCHKYKTIVNRIDLSLDDFSNIINMRQLADKVYKQSFTSNTRTWKVREGNSMYEDYPHIIKSKNDGCTITFGTRRSKQLVIYNKVAERQARNHVVNVNHWIRYESRFFGETGVKVLELATKAFDDGTFNYLVPSLIKGIVDFKMDSKDVNKTRIPTWHLWEKLLGEEEKISVTNQADKESNLSSKQVWLALASGRILAKAFLTNPEEFDYYINYSIAQALEKFDVLDLGQVNELRIHTGQRPLTMAEAKERLEKTFRQYTAPNDYLLSVLKAGDFVLRLNEETGELSQ